MSTSPTIQHIRDAINTQLEGATLRWWQESIEHIRGAPDPTNTVLNISVAARRQCGNGYFTASVIPSHWSVTETVRIALLAEALNHCDDELQLLKNYYRCGDEYEKAALLKGLYTLNGDGTAMQIAINACRANSLVIYKAIALRNPYPAQHFPELNWNQLVLKSVFQQLDITHIEALTTRLNPKLSDMCFSYAEELYLADRTPPASLWLAVDFNDIDREKNAIMINNYKNHKNEDQRNAITRAL